MSRSATDKRYVMTGRENVDTRVSPVLEAEDTRIIQLTEDRSKRFSGQKGGNLEHFLDRLLVSGNLMATSAMSAVVGRKGG